MRKLIVIVSVVFLAGSCMKKVEELEGYKTNIFDVNYEGDQWFNYDDVYLYTNSFNDLRVRLEFSIPSESLSDLLPSHISVRYKVNEYPENDYKMPINTEGYFTGSASYLVDGSEEFCLTLSILRIEAADTTAINTFTECKSL